MPDSGFSPPTPAELARSLRDVLTRFDTLIAKIENQYVTKELHSLTAKLLEEQFSGTKHSVVTEKEAREVESAEIKRRLTALEATGATQSSVRVERETRELEATELKRRLGALEDTQRWLARLVGGIIITALVGLVVAGRGVVGQ